VTNELVYFLNYKNSNPLNLEWAVFINSIYKKEYKFGKSIGCVDALIAILSEIT
jgi:hypothetical protein